MSSYGYNGQILRIDLTTRTITKDIVPEILYRRYLGGGALSLYYLLNELRPGLDPLGPENILIFVASALTGTPEFGFSRYTVAAKSPLTHAYGEAEAGGWWAPELKFAGFDGIIIKGKATNPVYLWINNGKPELREASHLWGLPAKETQERIRKELGDDKIRITLIGPGGEKLVRFACVINELKHANGRTGMGAVMGAKNLKAIAVRGNRKMSLYNADAVQEITREVMRTYRENPGMLGKLGTCRSILPNSAGGMLPTRNFTSGSFEKAEDISGETMMETILVGRGTCYVCPIRCKREVRVEGPYTVDPAYGGPEYETMAAFGSLCGIGDLNAIAYANQVCQAYTIDTISTGTTIAFAMECFEKGIITSADTGGIVLRFGDADAMVKLVEMIAKREGLGDVLAEGSKRAAEKIGKGAIKYTMQVKGQEFPLHEPRGRAGLALQYAISPTGADHNEALHDVIFESEELPGIKTMKSLGILEPLPSRDLSSRKVRMFVYLQQLDNMFNSIGICNFTVNALGPMTLDCLVRYVRAVTGWDSSLWDLMKVGERLSAMARIFNIREGFSAKDDTLPDRIFQPLGGGALKGKKIDFTEFQRALKTYYQMMGWSDDGVPLKPKLEELELEWVTE